MKKRMLLFAMLAMLVPCLALAAHSGDGTVTVTDEGGPVVVEIAYTGDGTTLSTTIDVSGLVNSGTLYLFQIKDTFGTGGEAPDAHVVTISDADGDAILTSDSLSATDWIDGAEDMPNYWPVTENFTVGLTDIGSANTTTITIILVR